MAPVTLTRFVRQRRHLSIVAAFGIAVLLLAPSIASAQIALGTAQNFGALASSTVTNIGASAVSGDVGTSPGNAITGFPPGTATGLFHPGDPTAATAQNDLTTAYNAAAGTACTTNLTGQNLGGLTLTPGVYCFNSSAQLTGNLTLNFLGNPNANFLFQTGSTLTTASTSSVLAINTGGAGCLPNINWQIGSSATLGTGTNFAGNILALASITLNTGANLRGRALARSAAVTLDSNLSVGGCPVAPAFVGGPIPPPPPIPPPVAGVGVFAAPTLQEWALIFLGLMLAAMGGWYVRRQGMGR
jgi:hypothetical protein